jgi:hypothetical protein
MARSIEGLLARIQHPILKRMVAYWDQKRGARAWPLRADFDPLDFWFAVGYVSLIDVRSSNESPPSRTVEECPPSRTADESPPSRTVAGGRRRYFFRLDGTRQVDLFGVDFTGKFLDQVYTPEQLPLAEASYGTAVEQGEPQYYVRQVEFHERLIQYEIVILPLSRTGTAVDMLMTVVTRDEES